MADPDPYGLDLSEDVTVLPDALVQDAPGQIGEAHWNEEAKALIADVILHVVCSEPLGPTHPEPGAGPAHPAAGEVRRSTGGHVRQPGRRRPGRPRRQSPPRQE